MRQILLAIVLSSSTMAGTIDDSIPDTSYLAYANGFSPYTKQIRVTERDGKAAISTAVCISKRWALTAAHVVQDADSGTVGEHEADRFVTHDEFRAGKFGWFDIALVRIRDDFGLDYYPPLSEGHERPGDVVSIAGYGLTGKLSTGHERCDGKLRAGTNRIDRFEKTLLVCPASRGGSPLPYCIAPGDSGGPIFVGSGPDARLAGIASFTMRDKGPLLSREGEEMGATRVAYFRDWINEVISEKTVDEP